MKCYVLITVRDMECGEQHTSEMFVEIHAERNYESEALTDFLRYIKNEARVYSEEAEK